MRPGAPGRVEGRRGAPPQRAAAKNQGREGGGQGAESGGAKGPRLGMGEGEGGRRWEDMGRLL